MSHIKELYEYALSIRDNLVNQLADQDNKIAILKRMYMEECTHTRKRKEFWEDYHKREYGYSIYCIECGKYLGEE